MLESWIFFSRGVGGMEGSVWAETRAGAIQKSSKRNNNRRGWCKSILPKAIRGLHQTPTQSALPQDLKVT
ncbi:MAG: hypothetical protein DMG78_01330 [Acidobacteria bacterium]|nr:MAG: hypothetical protein DMG78_01330 [Acidobacteriota bacterium]